MRATGACGTIVAVFLLGATAGAFAAQKIDLGKSEYEGNCAVCHGLQGRGDGPYASVVTAKVADLTSIAKGNGGVYPFEKVYQSIDGTLTMRGHGTREMPIWGQEYRVRAAEYYTDMPYDPDAFVRGKILALTEYLARLQAK